MSEFVDRIIRYEGGEMDEAEAIQFFADLVRAGAVNYLQGSYGRGAAALIRDGIISTDGEVLVEALGDEDTNASHLAVTRSLK